MKDRTNIKALLIQFRKDEQTRTREHDQFVRFAGIEKEFPMTNAETRRMPKVFFIFYGKESMFGSLARSPGHANILH